MTDLPHDHAHAKDNSLDRLLFFSDGVFAIAITLLSIELHPPHDWDGTAGFLWARGWPGFAAYALSFLVIGVFWNSHRRIFTQINRFSQGVFLFNLLLLGAIGLMPFMTNLLYREGPKGDAFAVYLGTVAVAGILQGLMLFWAVFVNRSVDPSVHWSRRVTAILSAGLLPGLFSAASMLMYGAISGGGVPIWLPLVLFGVSALVITARGRAEKRFS
jgi:uncharacterized membrane protein